MREGGEACAEFGVGYEKLEDALVGRGGAVAMRTVSLMNRRIFWKRSKGAGGRRMSGLTRRWIGLRLVMLLLLSPCGLQGCNPVDLDSGLFYFTALLVF